MLFTAYTYVRECVRILVVYYIIYYSNNQETRENERLGKWRRRRRKKHTHKQTKNSKLNFGQISSSIYSRSFLRVVRVFAACLLACSFCIFFSLSLSLSLTHSLTYSLSFQTTTTKSYFFLLVILDFINIYNFVLLSFSLLTYMLSFTLQLIYISFFLVVVVHGRFSSSFIFTICIALLSLYLVLISPYSPSCFSSSMWFIV